MASTSSDGSLQNPPHTSETVTPNLSFKCAVTDSKGPRRFMEDAHSIVVPFAGVRGQGFFAIFDGHAGKQAAEWCGQHFVSCFLNALRRDKNAPIPDILNRTFHDVDNNLSKLSLESDGKMHSGCTAVTAFLRLEDESGGQSFLPHDFELVAAPISSMAVSNVSEADEESKVKREDSGVGKHPKVENTKTEVEDVKAKITKNEDDGEDETKPKGTTIPPVPLITVPKHEIKEEPQEEKTAVPPSNVRRVLYCANAGDARGVLCRGGKAVRLTYDHKGTDKQEAKRIMSAGGFVMNGRVNGVLAVTRSLGDSSMKEFVVGSPYTTETELSEQDEFLILACDGLWDVVNDQGAVDLVRGTADPRKAAEELLEHAYSKFSQDNVTVLVVRFRDPSEPSRTN